MRKVPVGVLAEFAPNGTVKPLSITWTDGRIYSIENVLEKRNGRTDRSLSRYIIRTHGCETYLYRQADQWFMEGAE